MEFDARQQVGDFYSLPRAARMAGEEGQGEANAVEDLL